MGNKKTELFFEQVGVELDGDLKVIFADYDVDPVLILLLQILREIRRNG